MKRGMLTVEQLRARCKVDPVSHCWEWQGSKSRGYPQMWTLDYARIEKRVMSGPLGAWHIAYQAPPRAGYLVFRACQNILCLNPAHLREARDKAEIGVHIRRLGSRRATSMDARRANMTKAHAALGLTPTPAAKVLAVRAAGPAVSNKQLGELLGLSRQVVSTIRAGKSRAGVTA